MNLFVDDLHLPSCENKETGIGSVSEVLYAQLHILNLRLIFTCIFYTVLSSTGGCTRPIQSQEGQRVV